jgi:NADH:ubiquinone oxidoreductase subunit 4 (subunit M)
VIAPLVAVILAFALYPQLALDRSEDSVKASIRDARAVSR